MAEYRLKFSALTLASKPEKLITLALLFFLLTTATAAVTSVLIGPDWGSLWKGLLFGLLIGWVLGILRQPAWRAALITGVAGVIYVLLFTGGLREKVPAILIELAAVTSRIVDPGNYLKVDLNPLAQLTQELFTATTVIIERVHMWIMAIIAGEPTFDPVAAALVWSIIVWIIAAWAGWTVEARRSALFAVLPALLLSLGLLSYSRRESATLYLMLGATLLLLATVQQDRRRQGWIELDVAYPPRKGRQIGNSAFILVVALVILSAIVSSLSLPRIVEWVSARRGNIIQPEGGLAKSLGIMASTTVSPDVFEDVRRPGLPRALLIGTGPELSGRIVMTVAVEDLFSVFKGKQPLPFYWRGLIYDTYTGHGWQTSSTSLSQYGANQPLQPAQAPQHTIIQQTVRFVHGDASTVYVAGEPVTINHFTNVAWRSPGDLFGIQISSVAPVVGYEARSLFPVIDVATLRAAGEKYPGWVMQRFLSLPSDLPGRVKDLALQLTASEPTPYDRARAIERYLRTIPYSLDVPLPPPNQDLVDFFLFDLRMGYCDYYASAMVVLARAAGIPARFSIGYASGTYHLNSRRFQVSEADAHSWVEVYFPNIGWVPFEPTAGRPSLENPQSPEVEVLINGVSNEATSSPTAGVSIPRGWLIVLGGLVSLGILGIIWITGDEIRLCYLPELAAAGEVYRRMRRYGAHMQVALTPGDTPYEFADSLASRLQELLPVGSTPAFMTHIFEEVHTITVRIVRASYRPSQLKDNGNNSIYHQWRALRWQLRLMWLIKQYKSPHTRLRGIIAGIVSDTRTRLNRRYSRDGSK